ncbi:MAG: hypothetical protein M3139_01170 [Bacteroidota bacterium]|nr:hypothetical protein [Bacteroidota bacterium]
MEKNWYMLYVKQGSEKKVLVFLKRKKIESFSPTSGRQPARLKWSDTASKGLFKSYLFANLQESDLRILERINTLVNLVYWKNKPVQVKNDEIEAIKEFTTTYDRVKLERSPVDPMDEINTEDNSYYTLDGIALSVKKNSIKTNLPSIGFTMVAELSSERELENNLTSAENNRTNFYNIKNLKSRLMSNRQ